MGGDLSTVFGRRSPRNDTSQNRRPLSGVAVCCGQGQRRNSAFQLAGSDDVTSSGDSRYCRTTTSHFGRFVNSNSSTRTDASNRTRESDVIAVDQLSDRDCRSADDDALSDRGRHPHVTNRNDVNRFPNQVVRRSYRQAATGKLACDDETEMPAWTLAHRCTIDDWKNGHAKTAGFAYPVLTTCDGYIGRDCAHNFCASSQLPTMEATVVRGLRSPLSATRQNGGKTKRQQCRSDHSRDSRRSRNSSPSTKVKVKSRLAQLAAAVEYHWVPAERRMRVVGIVCCRSGLIVISLQRRLQTGGFETTGWTETALGKVVFGLVGRRADFGESGQFVGLLAGVSVDVGSLASVAGELTCDLSRCMIKVANRSTGSETVHIFDVISRAMLTSIDVTSAQPSRRSLVTFDPRYHGGSRLAISGQVVVSSSANEVVEPEDDITNTLTNCSVNLVDVVSSQRTDNNSCYWKTVAVNIDPLRPPHINSVAQRSLHHNEQQQQQQLIIQQQQVLHPVSSNNHFQLYDMRYAPDGFLLFVTAVETSALVCRCQVEQVDPVAICINFKVCVLDSATAITLRHIDFRRTAPTCVLHRCSTNFVPKVSFCGTYLAVVTDSPQPLTNPVIGNGLSTQTARSNTQTVHLLSSNTLGYRRRRRRRHWQRRRRIWMTCRGRRRSSTSGFGQSLASDASNRGGCTAHRTTSNTVVEVYRLPAVAAFRTVSSRLQASCRRAVIRSVARCERNSDMNRKLSRTTTTTTTTAISDESAVAEDVKTLPLPRRLLRYLNYQIERA